MERRILLLFVVTCLVRASRGGASRLQNENLFQNNPWEEYWIEKLPNTQRPNEIATLASHLNTLQTRTLMRNLQYIPGDSGYRGNPGSSEGSFCRNYGFLCGGDVRGPLVCVGPYWYNYGTNRKCDSGTTSRKLPNSSPQTSPTNLSNIDTRRQESQNDIANITPNIFFRYSNFSRGTKLFLPKLDNNLQGRTFLPAQLAKIMPLDSKQLETYLKVFEVPNGSNMAAIMEYTLSFCNTSNEDVHTCHASIESMVDFVVKEMGSNVVSLMPSFNSMVESSEVYFLEKPIALSSTNDTSITCHDLMFPYLVYGCHVIPNSIVYDTVLQKEGVPIFHAPFVCHMDTSSWNPSHVAFVKLHAHQGDGPICHWVPQNNFIWVKT